MLLVMRYFSSLILSTSRSSWFVLWFIVAFIVMCNRFLSGYLIYWWHAYLRYHKIRAICYFYFGWIILWSCLHWLDQFCLLDYSPILCTCTKSSWSRLTSTIISAYNVIIVFFYNVFLVNVDYKKMMFYIHYEI